MKKFLRAGAAAVVLMATGCAYELSEQAKTIKEADLVKEIHEGRVKGCAKIGEVKARNDILVGTVGYLGRRDAYVDAMEQAAKLGGTHIIWDEEGTNLVSLYSGRVYKCAA